jgi:hypothetical protein
MYHCKTLDRQHSIHTFIFYTNILCLLEFHSLCNTLHKGRQLGRRPTFRDPQGTGERSEVGRQNSVNKLIAEFWITTASKEVIEDTEERSVESGEEADNEARSESSFHKSKGLYI